MSDDNAAQGNRGDDAAATDSTADLGTDAAAMSSMETPDAENPNEDEDAASAANPEDGKLKDGVPSADWLPENSPPTTSGPVP